MSDEHTVYRHYGTEGQLLYVGYTGSFKNRQGQHRSSAWFNKIARTEQETFATSAEALDKEWELIRDENPQFNRQRRRGSLPRVTDKSDLKMLSFRLSDEARAMLRALAQHKSVTMTSVVEDMLRRAEKGELGF